MKWKSDQVADRFKLKILTAIRLSCSSLLVGEESLAGACARGRNGADGYRRRRVARIPRGTDADYVCAERRLKTRKMGNKHPWTKFPAAGSRGRGWAQGQHQLRLTPLLSIGLKWR